MKCPIDQTVLEISMRHDIEIDYCPTCRGVWLDRGELDKIIERSERNSPQDTPVAERVIRDESSHSRDKVDYDSGYHKRKKKESFIGDLFDF